MSSFLIIAYSVFLLLAILMSWQESRKRNISFIGALALSILCGTVLPIIGFVAAYIFISGVSLKDEPSDEECLDETV
ncbi:MAG: hypothetical protein AB8B53_15135 [Flavobacteriales bacterium]